MKPLLFAAPALCLLPSFLSAGPYDEAVSADGPVAYWRFEEAPGSPTASDSGSSGTDGTYNGITLGIPGATENLGTAAQWSEPALPDNPGSSNIDFGEFGAGALAQLTNIDDPPDDPAFNPDKKTSVEFWMNTTQVSPTPDNWRSPLVFGEESPGDGDVQWGYLRPSGQLGFTINDGNHAHHQTASPINDGTWHHFVFTYDWSTGISELYLDGVLESSFQGGGNRYQDADGGLIRYMGWNSREDAGAGDSSPHLLGQFVGLLDEVAIYDKILSGDRVVAHFNAAYADSDGDGLRDDWETEFFASLEFDGDDDNDGDGSPNSREQSEFTDPTNADTDDDGYLDGVETNTGSFVDASDTGTDPLDSDTDDDGLPDGVETNTGSYTSPEDRGSNPFSGDTDADGLGDAVETGTGVFVNDTDTGTDPSKLDTDGDTFDDREEIAAGSDPNDSNSTPTGRPLTPYELAVQTDEPISYWRFEEDPGSSRAFDDGSSGTDGTYRGIALARPGATENLGRAAEWLPAALPDNPGSSHIDFATPGAGALAQLTNVDAPQDAEFDANKKTSVEFWMNTTQVSPSPDNWRSPVVFGVESPGDGDIQWAYLRPEGNLGFTNNDANHAHHQTAIPVNDGTWRHFVFTYDWTTGTSQIYVNGALDSSFQGGDNRYHDADARIRYIGWNHIVDAGAGENSPHLLGQYEGLLDEIAIYDKILSSARIMDHYNAAFEPTGDPSLSLPRHSIFGELPAAPTVQNRVFQIVNNGATQTLEISAVTVRGTDADHFTVLSFPDSLAPQTSGDVEVQFDSQGRSGGFLAFLDFASNDEDVAVRSLPLAARIAPPSGLAIHFRMDETEGTTAFDSAGLSRHGTYFGNHTLGQAPLAAGTSVQFDVGDPVGSIGVPGDELPDLSEFSFSLWVNLDADAPAVSPLVSRGLLGNPFALAIQNGADLLWFAGGEAEPVASAAGVITPGTTHHVVVTHGEGTATLYLDGVEVATGLGNPLATGTGDLLLASLANDTGALGMKGRLDDAQFFESILSLSDVEFLFNNPGEPLTGDVSDADSDSDGLTDVREADLGTDPLDPDSDDDGLLDGAEVDTHGTDPLLADTDQDNFSDLSEIVFGTDPNDSSSLPGAGPYDRAVLQDIPLAYWRLDEPAGSTVADDSGVSGTDGTYNGITLGVPGGGTNLGTSAEWLPPQLPDNPGSSNIDFGDYGAGALAQLSNIDDPAGDPNFDPNKKTSVEFWINTTQVSPSADNWRSPIVFGEESPGDGDIHWGYLRPTGEIAFAVNDGNHLHHQTPGPINDGQWHHVVFTYDWEIGLSQLFLDGDFVSEFGGGNNRYQDADGGLIRYMGWNSRVDGGAGENSPHLLGQFVGRLDEVAVYDHILAAERVAAHYSAAGISVGPGADNDGDGQSDAAEEIAGTDPDDPTDYLRITTIARSATEVDIAWSSVDGLSYDVEYSTSMETDDWVVIGSHDATGDTGEFADTDAGRLENPDGYYRARVRR